MIVGGFPTPQGKVAMPATNKRYVRVRAKVRSKRERIESVGEDRFVVEVCERAERGVANARIRELLAHELACKPEALRLVTGATAPSKLFLLLTNE